MADVKSVPKEKEPKEEKQNPLLAHAYKILKDSEYLYCLEEGKFYCYKNGFWNQVFDKEFLGQIQKKYIKLENKTLNQRKEIMENFKILARKGLKEFNWADLMNMKNGMLSPYDGSINDHDATFKSTIRIPYEFNEGSKCELWLKSLNEIFENDQQKIGILQEFFGYCLTRETKHHKALLLLGESRSGKSTILDVLNSIIGEENCAAVPLKYISNPQYTAMLINKLVDIDYDVSGKAEDFEAEFKIITTGEKVQVNQKFIPAFTFYPYCKMAMAANTFPRITDHTSAFYNRLILIPCNRVFSYEEQNRDLPEHLLKETPGILNWAISGLQRLVKRGRFEELNFMKDAIQELEDDNNPSNIFFEEYIVTDNSDGVCIEKGELFEKYQKWAKESNTYILSKSKFASAVYRKFHRVTPKDTTHHITRKRIWKNLKYIENKNQPDKGWQE